MLFVPHIFRTEEFMLWGDFFFIIINFVREKKKKERLERDRSFRAAITLLKTGTCVF